MVETAIGHLDVLRDQWRQEWPLAWPDPQRRADLVDRRAWIDAARARAAGAYGHEVATRATASALAEQVVRDQFPQDLVGPFAPAVSEAGGAPLRWERSRPGWHLRGVAPRVPWSPAPRAMLVLGLDEGDNAVLGVVDVAASGVVTTGAGPRTVFFDDVAVPGSCVVHSLETGAVLRDRLTVLGLTEALDVLARLASSDEERDDVELGRAAVARARRSIERGPSLVGRRDVSSAAVVVLLTCERLGYAPDARHGVEGLAWHRERLAPLL